MSTPDHVAIIMDGNGRWAKQRSRPRTFGHIKGTRVARKIITACTEKGIKFLTLYAFSSENWLRPSSEVSFLMGLLHRYLQKETKKLIAQNIRFSVIGDLSKLPNEVLKAISSASEATKNNTGMRLTFAISYGSRQEIVQAVKSIAQKVKNDEMDISQIDEAAISSELYTSFCPSPDLVIRTSGEKRLSNFLMWQSAYSELYFTDILWPDFTAEDLDKALEEYNNRERRFGGIKTDEITSN